MFDFFRTSTKELMEMIYKNEPRWSSPKDKQIKIDDAYAQGWNEGQQALAAAQAEEKNKTDLIGNVTQRTGNTLYER